MSDRAEKINSFNDRAIRAGWPSRCDCALSFSSPLLRDALAVWREKAGRHPWPSRAEMTPRAMKGFLPNLAIVEIARCADTLRYRMRLTGTWIDRHLLPASDRFIDEVLPPPFLERWQDILGLPLEIEGPVRCVTESVQYRQQEFLEAEAFYAPLGNPGEPANAILAVVDARTRYKQPLPDSRHVRGLKVASGLI